VSGYGLDDRVIEVRSPAETKDFSANLCVQTGSGAHPASNTMSRGGPFPGAKRGRGVTLTTKPHLVPRSRMSRRYISSPQAPPWRVAGLLCFDMMSYWRNSRFWFIKFCKVDPIGRAVWGVGLRRLVAGSRVRIPLRVWMFVSCVYMLCCPVYVEASATGWSLVQRSPTKYLNKITKPQYVRRTRSLQGLQSH
jgi:hypothetical protein